MLAKQLHRLAEIGGVAAAQVGEQRVAEGIVHQAVRLVPEEVFAALGVGDLVRAVLPDLTEQKTVGLFLGHCLADLGDEFIGQFIGHVQPPGGCAAAQPTPHDRVRILDDIVNITFR